MKYTEISFTEKLKKVSPNIEVLEFDDTNRKVTVKCKKDGYIWSNSISELLRGRGCSVCKNLVIIKGKNDIATTHKELIPYLDNIEDAYTHSYGTNKPLNCHCPICGKGKKKIPPHEILKRGYGCSDCSDNVSYPNKIIRALVQQFDIQNYKAEYSPSWIGRKFYDVYFEYKNNKYIVEMDGELGHGRKSWTSNARDTDGKKRDEYKDIKAKENGIKLIRIDALKSNINYLRDRICESELKNIFDLSTVDWKKCEEATQTSRMRMICDMYSKNTNQTTYDLYRTSGISPSTIFKYIKRGSELGLCPPYNYEISKKIKSQRISQGLLKRRCIN